MHVWMMGVLCCMARAACHFPTYHLICCLPSLSPASNPSSLPAEVLFLILGKTDLLLEETELCGGLDGPQVAGPAVVLENGFMACVINVRVEGSLQSTHPLWIIQDATGEAGSCHCR